MARDEFCAWAQVGKNGSRRALEANSVRPITGRYRLLRYPVVAVFEAILSISPQSEEEIQYLLKPLQTAAQVSQLTGMSLSYISEQVRCGESLLPAPVSLLPEAFASASPRRRRWIAYEIEALAYGSPSPISKGITSMQDVQGELPLLKAGFSG